MRPSNRLFTRLSNVNNQMVGVTLLVGVASILFAERLTINNGIGWDGLNYAKWAKDFYQSVIVHGVPDYYTQRILPSLLVHYVMRLTGLPLDDAHIILAFDIYNLLLLLVATFIWARIADKLDFSVYGKWLGYCFLFLNYAILKNNYYNPVLTDTTAFALGLLMFYFFLIDSVGGLLSVIVVGGFTWPTVPFMAGLLLVFPYSDQTPSQSEPARARTKIAIIIAGLAALTVLFLLIYLTGPRFSERQANLDRALRIDPGLLWLSILTVPIFVFVSLETFLQNTDLDISKTWNSLRWWRLWILLIALTLIQLGRHSISSGEPFPWTPKAFVAYSLLSSLTEPFIFLVAHVVYYGPAIILLILFWSPFAKTLGRYGPGLTLFVVVNLILSINPQSRYQINAVSIFIILVTKLISTNIESPVKLLPWVLLSLLFSKVWYRFNTAPQVDDGTMASLQNFPLQHYFMGSGPWMSKQMYLAQGSVVMVAAVLVFFLTHRARQQLKSRLKPDQT